MAMTKCKECGNTVSQKAKQCPSCGAPNKAKGGCLKRIMVIFGLFLVVGAISAVVNSSGTSTSSPTPSRPKPAINPSEMPQPLSAAVLQARKNLSTNRVDITLADGTTYVRCKITRVEPDGISVIHASGIAKLAFPDLPQEYQQHYGYSEYEAQAYRQQLAETKERKLAAHANAQSDALAEESYKAGFEFGYGVGKTAAWDGKARDGLRAHDLGKINATSHEGDRASYAKGFHEGYNEGWHAAKGAGAPVP